MKRNGNSLTDYWVSKGSITPVDLYKLSGEDLKGQNAYLNTKLDFYEEKWNEEGKWVAIKDNELLQLKSFADKDHIDGLSNVTRATDITADTSWYNTTDTEFTINTVEELYGFAQLSNTGNTFAGITIKLGKDIVVNKASMNPEDYATGEWVTAETNFVKWVPIAGGDSSTVNVGFAGTFDGQDHTISGLYMKSDGAYLGLFATTAADGSSTIKNLKLTNSYFECTRTTGINGNELEGLGSIIGQGAGLIDTVYSDAIVVSGFKNVGGFVGNQRLDNTQLTIQNSWFDGKVTGTQWVGGLVGFSYAYVGSTNLMNCLVTADLTATATAQDTAYIGGIAGRISKGEISSCVAQGTITVPSTEHYPAGIVRTIVNAGSVTLKDIYNAMEWKGTLVTNHHYPNRNDSNVVQISENKLQGLSGYSVYLNKLDFYDEIYNPDGKWVLIKNRLPELRSFTRTAFETKPVDGLSDFAAVKQDGTKTVTDYENYITELESTGYKLYASNKGSDLEPYVRTATYKKGEEVVTVSYVDKTSELYVSSGENVSLSKHLKPEAATTTAYTNGERTTMYMPELYEYGDSFIIQLKNGHFIVIDGGMTADALYLIKDLVELAGDKKPVIEAWFISHGDSDHAGPLMRFADFIDQSSYADKIIVEGIYYNVPYYDSDDSNSQAYLNQIKTILIGAAKCKTSSGATPKVYRPQIGQKYYFDDITVDVMYTHEQLGSSVWSTDANEASTWLRMTIDGKTFLHSGDALQHSISGFTGVYDSDFLDFDVVTTPHHAQHVTEDFLNSVIKENKTKVLYTTFITDTQTIRYSYNENELLREKVGEGNYICWGDGTVVVTFDGEQVEISHQNKRTWDWHPNRKTPTQFL